MTFSKRTKLPENVKFQLRGEVFNLFNRPNFKTVITNFNAPKFGSLTETDEARVFQLCVKILF